MIVVLTGAGISKESGLQTFRDQDGLWSGHSVEDVCTPQALERNRPFVLEFYNARRREFTSPAIAPNAAHAALARLEAESRRPVLIVTQNIDTLHEQAGSKNILHMHGEIDKAFCQSCKQALEWKHDLTVQDSCPLCGMKGRLRPHIVFFNEVPLYMDEIDRALSRCTLFIAIGTSGVVYPAAGFSAYAKSRGAYCVELNLEPSRTCTTFHEARHGPATRLVPAFVDELLSKETERA